VKSTPRAVCAPEREMSPRTRWAAVAVSEVFAPAVLAIALGLAVAWHAAGDLSRGLGWGALMVLFTGVIPYAFILLGVRRGKWANHHIPDRAQRPAALLFGVASVLVGLGALVALGAPRELVALAVAMLVGLSVALAITFVWKISIHVAVASGAVVILALVFGPWLYLTATVAVAVAWSRLVLGAHTAAQVIGGAIVGAFIAGAVFIALTH
jgi:membrane-associated phospholipid phosphatase